MKVLVTGAAGFIGSHLCEALLAAGCSVTGVDDFDPYYDRRLKERNLLPSLAAPKFAFAEMDLRDPAATSALLSHGWECVVHLAGRGGVRRSITEPRAYLEINYGATLNVLEGMREAGTQHLVFASTSSVSWARRRSSSKKPSPQGTSSGPRRIRPKPIASWTLSQGWVSKRA